MKVVNQICRFLAIALGLASIVMFFFPIVTLTGGSELTAAQLTFGTKVGFGGTTYDLYVSSYYLFTFILTAFATVMAVVRAFVKKAKGAQVTAFVTSLIAGIVMLVISLSPVQKFVDTRPLTVENLADLTYAPLAVIIAVLILGLFAISFIGWLVNDYIEVLASKGQKLTIWQKVKKFCREMVAEIKKIVWPTPKTVGRNSVIVLIMCAILGAFIWLVDFLLGLLVKFITTL